MSIAPTVTTKLPKWPTWPKSSVATGRAMVCLLSVFAEFERDILSERIKAGIAQARSKGKPHGRPKTAALNVEAIKNFFAQGLNKSEIARRLKIGRTSCRPLS